MPLPAHARRRWSTRKAKLWQSVLLASQAHQLTPLPRNSDEDQLERSRAGSGCFLIRLIPNPLDLKCAQRGPWSKVMAQKSARKSSRPVSRRKPSRSKSSRRKSVRHQSGRGGRRWSARVTRESDALDLQRRVFTGRDPKKIAASLKRSAERSRRRKSNPYRSALSMLTFYINRAGKNLPASRRKTLQRAKGELRKQFGRD